MALLLCLSLLLTASAGEIVHEQGDPASQQSCSSDQDTVTFLQSAVRIPDESTRQDHDATVIEEQTTQEDDKEKEKDDEEEEMDEEDEEDDEREDDEEDQVDEQAGPEDEEEQISAMVEKGRGGKVGNRHQGSSRWGRNFTTEAIGKRLCQVCGWGRKRMNKKRMRKLEKCGRKKDFWPQNSVRVDTSRRRAEGSHECMAVSTNPKAKKDFVGFGVGSNKKKGTMAGHRKSRNKICTCLRTILKGCEDADCIQEKVCHCPAICCDFKIDLGCFKEKSVAAKQCAEKRVSLLERQRASERNSLSERLASERRASSGTVVQNDLDSSVQGKCTAETQ